MTEVAVKPMSRLASALVLAVAAVAAVVILTFAETGPEAVLAHLVTFYAVTAGAYVALPFIRRGDILMAAVWLVLAAGVGPCLAGREISAAFMFADLAGVAMAAGPIYIARLRQVAQGDTRPEAARRRAFRPGLFLLPGQPRASL